MLKNRLSSKKKSIYTKAILVLVFLSLAIPLAHLTYVVSERDTTIESLNTKVNRLEANLDSAKKDSKHHEENYDLMRELSLELLDALDDVEIFSVPQMVHINKAAEILEEITDKNLEFEK